MQMKMWSWLRLSAILAAWTIPTQSQMTSSSLEAPFTKITTGSIVTIAGSSRGCAWGDFDRDGFIDLYVSNSAADGHSNGRDFLFHNNGDGTFTEMRAQVGIADPIDSQACTWIDYDNDGRLDLFVSAYFGGKDALYHNEGNGRFAPVTSGDIVLGGGNATAASWSDFNNDGWPDLLVANSLFSDSPSLDLLYQNLGLGQFRRLTNSIVAERRYGRGLSWADYDNDGRPDTFIAVASDPALNRLYHNEGNGSFSLARTAGLSAAARYSFSGSWADYDNDGNLDLFVANGGWEAVLGNFLYRNQGNGTFASVTNGVVATDRFGSVYGAWGDYDNDGFLDLFVSHSSLGSSGYLPTVKNRLYHNRGDGTFEAVESGHLVNDLGCSLGCAWGDYDNDGFLDLFVTNFGARVNDLFHNNGNSNAWLMVQCEGTGSNRSAIGAKVRVKATIRGRTMWQLREISGSGGYTSQNDLRAHFGLGDATVVDVLRIEWPSGVVSEFRGIKPRQILRITEPPLLHALGTNGFGVRSWPGQTFVIEDSTDLQTWKSVGIATNLNGLLTFPAQPSDVKPRRFFRARID
jgi:hypothetical protein